MPATLPPISDADLRQLRVFRAVVEANGFTAAQGELGLARSTISAQMAELETRLGLTLCRRGRGGFALTEHGQRIYAETVKLLRALEDFRAEAGGLRGRLVGDLRVGVVDHLIENPDCHLSAAIADFKRRAPDVHLTVLVIPPNQIENALVNRQLQIALVPNLPISPGIRLHELFSEDQTLFCSKGHPFFDLPEGALDLQKVGTAAHARRGYAVSTPYYAIFGRGAEATAFDMEGLAYLILSGRFVGFLPRTYAERWVRRGEMRAIRPDLFGYRIGICLAHVTTGTLPRTAQLFRDAVLSRHGRKARG
ncbi:MAG: LysR family transcriptional regulator [Paracoccaceae bacterium]|nr:LysR family transcriptional regulator [Paracoccaceae bacterium]